MNASVQSFVTIFSAVLVVLFVAPTLLDGAPNRRPENKNSVVFNVWEFARVAGPRFTTTTTSPQVPADAPPEINRLPVTISPCVWAIASCCHAREDKRRDGCFEALGCPGAWFENLCTRKFMESALSVISPRISSK